MDKPNPNKSICPPCLRGSGVHLDFVQIATVDCGGKLDTALQQPMPSFAAAAESWLRFSHDPRSNAEINANPEAARCIIIYLAFAELPHLPPKTTDVYHTRTDKGGIWCQRKTENCDELVFF